MNRTLAVTLLPKAVLSLLVLTIALSTLATTASAQDKYAAEFLKVPLGARALGMGGAFSALADDATAVYWNPAGLIFANRNQVWAEHSEQFGGVASHDFIAYSRPLERSDNSFVQGLGLGFIHSGVDEIQVNSIAVEDLEDGVHYDDENGNDQWDVGERLFQGAIPFEEASVTDLAFLLSYARTMGSLFSIGGTVKIIRQSLPGNASFGIGADLGFMYFPHPSISAALRVSDVTTTLLSWDSGRRETLAPSVTLGFQYTRAFEGLNGVLTVAGDMDTSFDNRKTASGLSYGETVLGSDFHAGLEYWYAKTLALRFGGTTNALTGGGGFRYRGFGVDYAFIGDHPDLDASHRIGGSYSF